MRLVRVAAVAAIVVVVSWLSVQSVSVEANREEVRITIDREKLQDAGRQLSDKGRRAIGDVRRAFNGANQPPHGE